MTMSSEIMTVASAPGVFGGAYMDYGRLPRSEIIRRTKELASHEKKKWEEVLATPDDKFDVRIVRGVQKMTLVEELPPAIPASPLRGREARLQLALIGTLDYERECAKLDGLSDCTCMGHSLTAENAYEMGECPHQVARAVLASPPEQPPLRGREAKPSAWRACWVSLNTSRTQLFEIEADANAKARETGGCVIPLSASPPEQPAALPLAVRLRDEAGPPLPQMIAQRRAQLSQEQPAADPVKALGAMGFIGAMDIVERGFIAWKDKPHNKKWFKHIDGTPIPNDLAVNIAEAIVAALAPETQA